MSKIGIDRGQRSHSPGWNFRSHFPELFTLAWTLTLLLAFAHRTRDLGFLGWDAYPILAASQIETIADWPQALARPLGDGLIGPVFFRPLLTLLLSIELSLWGLHPWPYLLFNIVLFGLVAALLFLWIREITVGLEMRRGSWLASAATLLFVSHPAALDVIPFLPRRADLLCTLFVIAALLLDHRGRFRNSRLAIGLAWIATAAALSSKETAIALPVLILLSRLLFPASDRPWREATRGFLSSLAIVAIAALPRWLVLGGAGRTMPSNELSWIKAWAVSVAGVFVPELEFQPRSWLGFCLVVIGCASMVWLAEWRRLLEPARWRLLLFGVAWSLVFSALYAMTGRVSPWYLLIVTAGATLSFGTALEWAASGFFKPLSRRFPGVLTMIGGTLLILSFASQSPVFRSWSDMKEADRQSREFLLDLEGQLEKAKPGELVDGGRCTRQYQGIAMLTPNSIQGWIRLHDMEDRVEIVEPGAQLSNPDSIRLQLH